MILDELRQQATLPEGDFLSWDTMAVELEVAELLYALVRKEKPKTVVECGSGNGYASVFLAAALAANGPDGRLITFEQDPHFAPVAGARLDGLPAELVEGFSWEVGYRDPLPDLIFIDTLGNHRPDDMDRWFAAPWRPLIVIHDASHYPPETFPSTGVLLGAGRGVWIGRSA